MGMTSIWHWLIVLVIVMLLFGTKKLGSIGKDLGSAVKGFKDGIKEAESGETGKTDGSSAQLSHNSQTIDAEVHEKKDHAQ